MAREAGHGPELLAHHEAQLIALQSWLRGARSTEENRERLLSVSRELDALRGCRT
jgi:hypothetical protein